MTRRGYTAQYYGHIESLDYRDGYGQLWLQCTHTGTPRVYCTDTAELPFSRREQVLENLCDYFETAANPAIVVVDKADKDRKELEQLITRLAAEGQKITIEYETAEGREQAEEGWHLRWLGAGKKLKVEGTEIATTQDYLRWKNARKGAAQKGGSSASDDNSSDTKQPPD